MAMVRITVLGSVWATTWIAAIAAAAPLTTENFEGATVPPGWNTGALGKLEVTAARFKSGRQSLCWTWREPGATLTGTPAGGPVAMPENRSMAFWLYNEKPREQILQLELLRGSNVVGRAWYVLNFQGWRPLGAPYRQVVLSSETPAPGVARLSYDRFRLIVSPAPTQSNGEGSGRLYLDYVNYQCPDKLRADAQQPWVGRPDRLKAAAESMIYSSRDIARNRPWLPKLVPQERITAEEWNGMATLRSRHPLPAGCTPRNDPSVLDEFHEVCRIRRSPDGTLTGRPIVPPREAFNSPPDGIVLYDRLNPARKWAPVSAESPVGVALGERLKPATPQKPAATEPHGEIYYTHPPVAVGASPMGVPMLQRLGEAYAAAIRGRNPGQATLLKQAFFDLCDHLLDQGFAEGNGNSASWCFPTGAVIGMRKELEQAGRLRDMALACVAFGTSYSDGVLTVEDWRTADILGAPRNTDGFGNYIELLNFILLLPDPSERVQRLYAFRRAVSLLCDPQLGEPYAWDGTCHHHMMFHPGYSAGALVPQALSLRDTCFRLTPEAIAVLKRSAMMLAFMADSKGILPANCPGYTGVPLGIYGRPENLGLFASVGTAESVHGVDPDLAGIYLAFHADNPNPPDLVGQFQARGMTPGNPSGHVSVNGASISLHRRAKWLVAIAGKYKFRRGLEPNYTGSLFNHYSRNGSVFVVSRGNPPSPWDSGYSLEGWDARHYPGTTAYLGEPEGSLLCRSRGHSENVFGGGTDLEGDGIWGMNSLGQTNPQLVRSGNITFTKSAFCFGERVTLITTGIGRCALAGDEERRLELATTLWQNAFGSGGQVAGQNLRLGFNTPAKPPPTPPGQEPCWVSGARIEDFPWEGSLPPGPSHSLLDNKRTGYFVHAGSPPIRLVRRHQTWTYPSSYLLKPAPVNKDPADLRNFQPTEGDFSVGWFEHGAGPAYPECIYTLIPDTTPEAMAQFTKAMAASDPPYRILQKDALAHVLRDRDSKTTGYLVFVSSWTSTGTILQAVNRPCSVMVKETDDGLRVSVASTDMDSWLGEIRLSGEIALTLRGAWRPRNDGASVTQDRGRTIVRIPFRTFMPAVVTLAPLPES